MYPLYIMQGTLPVVDSFFVPVHCLLSRLSYVCFLITIFARYVTQPRASAMYIGMSVGVFHVVAGITSAVVVYQPRTVCGIVDYTM